MHGASWVVLDVWKRRVLIWLAAMAGACVLILQWWAPGFELDAVGMRAAEKTERAYEALKAFRSELGIAIDPVLDPKRTGLIGCEYSDLTTTVGDLAAKQTSINPVFAAIIVSWLEQAGVKLGDTVAASFSGSFPALNVATLCAFDAMGLHAIVFSSVGASVYGANIPDFTWLDMEKRLLEFGIIRNRTSFASFGGIVDTEGGIDGTGFGLASGAITRHGAHFIKEGSPKTVERDAKRRMELFFSQGKPKAFVNVGGNVTSFGWLPEASLLSNGLLSSVPRTQSEQRGTIFRMFEAGVPVIHLLNVKRLAARHHIGAMSETGSITANLRERGERKWRQLLALMVFWFGIGCALLYRRLES